MDNISTFVCKSRFSTTIENLFFFHESALGFDALVGSVPGIEILQKPNSLNIGEIAIMKVPILPFLKVKWIAKHTLYEKNKLFQDTQVAGPFLLFQHTHKFYSENGDAILEDSIQYKAIIPLISKYIIGFILSQQFINRHKITANELKVEYTNLLNERIY